MRERLMLVGVVLLFAALATLWFLLTHERVEVNKRGEPSALVQTNRVFGFQEFLERYGIESQRLSSLNTAFDMPGTSDTLILGFQAVFLNDADYNRIADWVGAGGHLVLPLPRHTENSLLEYFNIHSGVEGDGDDSENEFDGTESSSGPPSDTLHDTGEKDDNLADSKNTGEANASEEDDEPDYPDRYVYDSRFAADTFGEFSVNYEVYDDLYSNRQTQWELELTRKEFDGPEDRRTYALGFQYGLGSVSLLSDYAHWNNNNFYHHDNALLSLAMLSKVRDPGKIWFVQAVQRTSLWDLIWNRAGHLVLWLGVVIALFFWWAGQRVGRIFPNPSLQRREFNEHLVASGRFLWSHKRQEKLLSRAQEALLNHAKRRYPRLHGLNSRQAELQLEEILEEHYATWKFAMGRDAPTTKPEFFEHIKAIQTLWKLL